MNLRDLWDNVVLRDVLGYIVPGLVTLLAISVLVRGITDWTLPDIVSRAARYAGLDFLDAEPLRPWQPWVAASLVVPLAYALGHLQMSVADYPEEPGRCWYTGRIALERLLEDSRLGLAYYSAAVKVLPAASSEDLRQTLVKGAGDCSHRRNVDAAKHLFLLCDRYVLHKDRDLHSMFMGRYYVLAVLFTNLGVSSVLLALGSLAALLAECQVSPIPEIPVAVLSALSLAFAFEWFRKQRTNCTGRRCCPVDWSAAALALSVLGLLLVVPPCLQVDPCRFLMKCVVVVGIPTAFGLALIHRSRYLRRRFVECTFPIFYAIVQAEDRSKVRHT